uniref:SFRICE_018879 n=1 Tax=Spodoptera frugiperda TaxID=7108 RepID=A0A2H1W5B9_SPOFR
MVSNAFVKTLVFRVSIGSGDCLPSNTKGPTPYCDSIKMDLEVLASELVAPPDWLLNQADTSGVVYHFVIGPPVT